MNKKTYIAPEMELVNVEIEIMMAMSDDTNSVTVYDEITEDDANMGRGRRGSWGNLWGE